MEYDEILDELQDAIRGLEMNTQFLILFSYKEEVLIEKCSEQTVEDCNQYLHLAFLSLNVKKSM